MALKDIAFLPVQGIFLLHLVSKMKPAESGGSRAGIILHGSALFGGGAGSGESEIRRHVVENDLVEAVTALPAELFHNTPIGTYLWILSNKAPIPRSRDDLAATRTLLVRAPWKSRPALLLGRFAA